MQLIANLKQISLQVLNGLSQGTVKAADFNSKFGKDADDALQQLRVLEVSRNGSRIELKRSAPSIINVQKADVHLAVDLSFNVVARSNGADVTKIKGIKVDAPVIPKLDLTSLFITDLPNGNTRLVMKLQVSRFLPDLSHTVTVRPDGQVV
jgi:hypothetical protein